MARKKKYKDLKIESIGFEGISIARDDGKVYFVKGGIPGDLVHTRLKKKRKNYTEAVIEEVLEPGDGRQEPLCDHFDSCGGCKWQHLEYDKQIYWKKQHVKDSFERLGKVEYEVLHDTLPAPEIYQYRNKMEFSFGASRWMTEEEIQNKDEIEDKHFALGLHAPGRFDKVNDIYKCHIQNYEANDFLNLIRDKAKEFDTKPHNTITHEGYLRNFVIRRSEKNDEYLVILVTDDIKEPEDEMFLNWYKNEFPGIFPKITNVIHAVNNTKSPVAAGTPEIIKGKGYITESILGVDFRISPFSFFQTNSHQLDQFIENILNFADLSGNETVWDLYCGTGSITLPASKRSDKIFGMELVESSVNDARNNAEINNIVNAEFFSLDLHSKDMPFLLEKLEEPDVIFIDPPRAGMHKNLIEHIMKTGAPKIVYVSCNPATQARDCEILSKKYEIKDIKPVDMFPHTYHIESIAKLELKK